MEVNKENSNNQIITEKLGMDRDPIDMPLLRKRSSLRPRCSMKESGVTNKLGLKRKITFCEDRNDDEKKSEKSYSESKTRFSSAVTKLIKK